MKSRHVVRKFKVIPQWRAVGYEGDVFYRSSERAAVRDSDQGAVVKGWSVIERGKNGQIIADCQNETDATTIAHALNEQKLGKVSL